MQVLGRKRKLFQDHPFPDSFESIFNIEFLRKEMGKKLRKARKKAGYTQDEISQLIHKSVRSIRREETGVSGIMIDDLFRYMYYYKIEKFDQIIPDSLIGKMSRLLIRSEDEKTDSSCSDIGESNEREQSIGDLIEEIENSNLDIAQINTLRCLVKNMNNKSACQ